MKETNSAHFQQTKQAGFIGTPKNLTTPKSTQQREIQNADMYGSAMAVDTSATTVCQNNGRQYEHLVATCIRFDAVVRLAVLDQLTNPALPLRQSLTAATNRAGQKQRPISNACEKMY